MKLRANIPTDLEEKAIDRAVNLVSVLIKSGDEGEQILDALFVVLTLRNVERQPTPKRGVWQLLRNCLPLA